MPTREEIGEVAQTALGLIGERPFDPMGHGPGYLYTATAQYKLAGRSLVRLSTVQDWEGTAEMPDMLVTVREGGEELGGGTYAAAETDYTFFTVGFLRQHYAVYMDVSEVTVGTDDKIVDRVTVRGDSLVRNLLLTRRIIRAERRALREAAEQEFDRTALQNLSDTLAKCNPGNKVPGEVIEW